MHTSRRHVANKRMPQCVEISVTAQIIATHQKATALMLRPCLQRAGRRNPRFTSEIKIRHHHIDDSVSFGQVKRGFDCSLCCEVPGQKSGSVYSQR